MLRILGSAQSFSASWNRRQVLQIGAVGMGLPQLLSLESASAANSNHAGSRPGKAMNILLKRQPIS